MIMTNSILGDELPRSGEWGTYGDGSVQVSPSNRLGCRCTDVALDTP